MRTSLSMARVRRAGFTLIELLGAPTMLTMSIGLFVPAVLVVGVRGAVQQDEEAVRQWIKALGNAQAIGQPITSVNLQGTQVTDEDLKKIAVLKNLESLNLTRTRVTDAGLKELAGLKNIKHLHLGWTTVTDVGLKEIAGIENLQQLDLHGTQVSGVGLKHLAPLKNLDSILLDRAKITDGTLRVLREAGLLQTLADPETGGGRDAPEKRPTLLPPSKGEPPAGSQDSLPKRPARPEDVVRLNLVGAPLTDAGLKELADLKNLQSLDLRGTGIKLTGAGMKELAGLKRLNLLVLDESQITDETLRGLREAGMLQALSKATMNPETNKRPARPEDVLRLFLGMTQVTDAGLKELTGLKNLRYLGLGNTKVTDTGLKELAGFQNLEWLDLSATQVTDAGLKELAGLKKLRSLELVGSRVTEAGLRERAELKTPAAPVIKGDQLLVTSPGSGTPSAPQIFRINADGSGRTQLTVGDEGAIDPALSPDGKRIAFVADARLNVMNADGSERKPLAERADMATVAPSWSPDGKQIAFGVFSRGPTGGSLRSRLYVVNADGRNLRQVGDVGALSAVWSPDGKQLLFTRMGASVDLYVMNVDGSDMRELVKGALMGAWSPDGQSLAYVLAGRREGGLYVARSDGSNARRLRNIAENESILGPKWSLDGKRLFFMRKLKDEPVAIYAIDADGRNTRRVTAGDAPEYLGGTCVLAGILFR